MSDRPERPDGALPGEERLERCDGVAGSGVAGGPDRSEKRVQTRAALLDSAERLWALRGIHGASLDDIAAAARLTKGAVYSNFTGKTDMLLALLDRYTRADLGPDIVPLLSDTSCSRRKRFHRVATAYVRRIEREDARLLALLLVEFWLYGMRDYTAGWRVADWYEAQRENLAAKINELSGVAAAARDSGGPGAGGGSAPGELSPRELATLAMAVDFGLAFQHLLDPERVPAELYGAGLHLVLGPYSP